MSLPALALILLASGPGERYAGEHLCYNFFIFSSLNVGTACISLEQGEDGSHYIATAEAVPNIIARNFTYVRKVILRTFMVEDKEQKKLLPYRTERIAKREKEEIETVYSLAGVGWTWASLWKGRGKTHETSGVVAVPWKIKYFEDPLSAVYNFRSGVYGEKKEGMVVRIQSLTHNGDGFVFLKILPPVEDEVRQNDAAYGIELTADGETLGFRFRDVIIWVGADDIPLKGTIRGAIPLFDITASLQKKD